MTLPPPSACGSPPPPWTVTDPEAEYAPLVNRLGGQVVQLSPVSTQYVNPMDINPDYSDEENPLTLKSDFSIYHEDTRAGQLARLRAVRPLYLGDPELLSVVDSAARKVEAMTAADFLATAFELTPPVLYAEGETEGAAYGE